MCIYFTYPTKELKKHNQCKKRQSSQFALWMFQKRNSKSSWTSWVPLSTLGTVWGNVNKRLLYYTLLCMILIWLSFEYRVKNFRVRAKWNILRWKRWNFTRMGKEPNSTWRPHSLHTELTLLTICGFLIIIYNLIINFKINYDC